MPKLTIKGKDFNFTNKNRTEKDYTDEYLKDAMKGINYYRYNEGVNDKLMSDEQICDKLIEFEAGVNARYINGLLGVKARSEFDNKTNSIRNKIYDKMEKQSGKKIDRNVQDDEFIIKLEDDSEYSLMLGDFDREQDKIEKAVEKTELEKAKRESNYAKFKEQIHKEEKDFRNVIDQRNKLAEEYKKTSLLSRIARWILPNSWSEAGRIQDQIDEIDKAVKDAGYTKDDIDVANATLAREKEDLSKNNISVSKSETKDLQNDLQGRINDKSDIQYDKIDEKDKQLEQLKQKNSRETD